MGRSQNEAIEALRSFNDVRLGNETPQEIKELANKFSLAVNSFTLLESEFAKSLMHANKDAFTTIAKKWLLYISSTDSIDLRNRDAHDYAKQVVEEAKIKIQTESAMASDRLIEELSRMHRTLQQTFTAVCIKALVPLYPNCKMIQNFHHFAMI